MIVRLSHPTGRLNGTVRLPASKSISNRVLIMRALSPEQFDLHNLSEAADTQSLEALLKSDAEVLDCGPAGTTFRFLTAYLSLQQGTRILTGTDRMKQRPIGPLVDALRKLGANIEYVEREGYPPLRITGAAVWGGKINIDSSTSSQFATAMALIAPTLPGGLTMRLSENSVSLTYLDMTLELMRQFGVNASRNELEVRIEAGSYRANDFTVESDWSAASYWYAMAVLAQEANLKLPGLHEDSIQGDQLIAPFSTSALSLQQAYTTEGVELEKAGRVLPVEELTMDLLRYPDLAQTVAVLCAALQQAVTIKGLQTLRIKETDRLAALQQELAKIDVVVVIENDSTITLIPPEHPVDYSERNIRIATYHDHRMAMAFAPLALLCNEVVIEDPEVVRKSYPGFWADLLELGFDVEFENTAHE